MQGKDTTKSTLNQLARKIGLCQVVSGIKFSPKAKLSKNALK